MNTMQCPKRLLNDIIQWDVHSWSKALDLWEKSIDWSMVNNALELGGREGGLSLWLANKKIATICSDLEDVKATAAPLHLRYGLEEFIVYEDIDATAIPYENHFDLIVFKSILGGIGRENNYEMQRKAIEQMHKALKPGGKLLFAENTSASPLHRFLRKKFVRWGDAWRYVSLSEMQDLLKDFHSVELKNTGVSATFGRSEKQRRIFSTIDTLLLNHLCPKSWKYIAYGIAEK